MPWRGPASYLQEQLFECLDTHTSSYNVPFAWTLADVTDRGCLTQALRELAFRHEALRTELGKGPNGIAQRVRDVEPEIWQLDLASTATPGAEFQRLIQMDVGRPFALDKGPLWHAVVARLGGRRFGLALVMNHGICDGWSGAVIQHDLTRLYDSLASRRPANLPELPIQFGDYAAWERSYRRPAAEADWLEALSPLPEPLSVPGVPPAAPGEPFELICRALPTVGADVLQRLQGFALHEGATLTMAVYAAAMMTVAPFFPSGAGSFGLIEANRSRSEVAYLVGPVFDYLPVRLSLAGAPTFLEVIRRIRDATSAARERRVPLFRIDQIVSRHETQRRPIFDVVLNFIPRARGKTTAGTGLVPMPIAADWQRIPVRRPFYGSNALSFVMRESSSGAIGGHLYGHGSPSAWDRLDELGHTFAHTIQAASADPHLQVP